MKIFGIELKEIKSDFLKIIFIPFLIVGITQQAYTSLKNKCNKRETKFRHIFLVFILFLGLPILFIILLILKIKLFLILVYLMIYLYFVYFTFNLIINISNVYVIKKGELTKINFLFFIIKYFFIIIVYIILFSLLISYTSLSKEGYFLLNDNFYPIDFGNSLFVSGITFVSYDIGLIPFGLMKPLVFIELFLSQIIILGFLFIVFAKLLDKLEGNI